jgi:hypothetical protein
MKKKKGRRRNIIEETSSSSRPVLFICPDCVRYLGIINPIHGLREVVVQQQLTAPSIDILTQDGALGRGDGTLAPMSKDGQNDASFFLFPEISSIAKDTETLTKS